MKNLTKAIMLILTLIVTLTGCAVNEGTESPSSDSTVESLLPLTLPDNIDTTPDMDITPEIASLYQGEILYDGIPILQFMGDDISTMINVLGEPLDIASRPVSADIAGIYVYDRLYVHVGDNTPIGYITMLPEVCEIDGVSLDKNRDELISILGAPQYEMFDEEGEYSHFLLLDFEIQGCLVRFCLETADEKASWMEIYDISSDPLTDPDISGNGILIMIAWII